MNRSKARVRMIQLVNTIGTAALGQRDNDARELVRAVEQYLTGIGVPNFDAEKAYAGVESKQARMTKIASTGGTLSESSQAARLLGVAVHLWRSGRYDQVADTLADCQAVADQAIQRRAYSGRTAKEISGMFDR